MAPPLIVRAVLDAAGYLKVSESVVSSNTLMGDSALGMGASFTKSAQAQVAAGAKVIASQREQLVQLKLVQAQAIAGSDRRIAADVAVARAQATLNRSMGVSVVSTRGFSQEAKSAERDLGKLSRGALAGSGLFSVLGRSLAFASNGFLAFAGGTALIGTTIRSALDLASTQRQVETQLKTSGKTWEQYGAQIDAVDLKISHISGFDDSDLLRSFGYLVRVTGNVSEALKLNAVAADVARGRHIALDSASLALAKALGGSVAGLRRLGIIIPQGLSRMEALAFVTKKFAGQAQAGATSADRFHAALVNTGETIGTALLPTFDRMVTRLGDWLAKANETGRIQRDANKVISIAGTVFHTLGAAIDVVNKITGSFGKTLLLIGEIWAGIRIVSWIGSLEQVAIKWGLIQTAAEGAAAAEIAAGAAGGAGAAGAAGRLGAGAAIGAAVKRLLGRGATTTGVVSRIGMYTGTGALAGEAGVAAGVSATGVGTLAVAALAATAALSGLAKIISDKFGGGNTGRSIIDIASGVLTGGLVGNFRYGILGQALHGFPIFDGPHGDYGSPNLDNLRSGTGPFQLPSVLGGKGPMWAGAGDTSGSGGFLPGTTPIREITKFSLTQSEQLAQAQAGLTQTTTDDVKAAREVVARIKRAIDHGRLHGAELIKALNAEASAMSTIWQAEDAAAAKRAAAAQAAKDKIEAQIQNSIDPLRLEVALSRAQALGKPIVAILRKLRAAAQKALASGKLSLEQQKEAWEQIKSINDQLASQSATQTHQFHLASTKALTAGLHLTDEQRRALRARLSQLGPGRHRPDRGTGAYGYEIGSHGRPIHVHTTVRLDGKKVASSTTKHQQRARRRSSSQRRGPNAGD